MDSLLAQCGALFVEDGNVFVSLLLAGLVGSLSHCSTMCGPLVAAQMATLPRESQSPTRLMLWYHAGRVTTYMLLGMAAATAGAFLFSGPLFSVVSSVFLMVAGGLFILSALKPKATHACGCQPRFLESFLGRVRLPLSGQLFIRGFLLGFMPCGMVLAALLLVATTHQVWIGGMAMVVFGISTVPILQMIGFGIHSLARRWRETMTFLGRGAMTLNGVVLCLVGIYTL